MAAGKHCKQREVYKVSCNKSNGFRRSCLHVSTEKNMKQVDFNNKEELNEDSFQVHRVVQRSDKITRPSPCKRKSSSSVEVGAKLNRRSSNVGRLRGPGMANKENEVTCSDDVRALHAGLPTISADASKMTGASSKYADFTELSKDHEAMTHILFGRDLRLKVALTLWRRNACELVSYLIRIQDTGVLLDCLPVLTNNLQTEAPCLSLGCCVDLMPQVKVVISSKYEEHITVGLHWVQSVIRKWWPELSKAEKRLQDSCSEDRWEYRYHEAAIERLVERRISIMFGSRICGRAGKSHRSSSVPAALIITNVAL
ncbi:KATNB1-like protein 1 isoform X4 [Girardinichthys multiradiatus]|nr:KATNB1-like protein 1 isoform X4 [Girardinichthys multiradiatus]